MGTSVERERGVMGSLYVQMLAERAFILGTSLSIGCRRQLVFIERARKTRFSLLSRARPRNFSLFTRKKSVPATQASLFFDQHQFSPNNDQEERLLELIQ